MRRHLHHAAPLAGGAFLNPSVSRVLVNRPVIRERQIDAAAGEFDEIRAELQSHRMQSLWRTSAILLGFYGCLGGFLAVLKFAGLW